MSQQEVVEILISALGRGVVIAVGAKRFRDERLLIRGEKYRHELQGLAKCIVDRLIDNVPFPRGAFPLTPRFFTAESPMAGLRENDQHIIRHIELIHHPFLPTLYRRPIHMLIDLDIQAILAQLCGKTGDRLAMGIGIMAVADEYANLIHGESQFTRHFPMNQ